MPKRAVLLLVLLALLLSGCGALEEGIEAGVLAAIRAKDEVWLEAWFPTLKVEDLPSELPTFLGFVVVIATMAALWYVPSGEYQGTIRWLIIVLGISLFVELPTLIGAFERAFLGDIKISEVFDGMDWVKQLVDLDLLGLVGAAWPAAAAMQSLNLPYYHQAAAEAAILIFLGCLLGSAIVGNTRPMMFSIAQIVGIIIFPLVWKIWAFWMIAAPKLKILGLYNNDDAVNAGFIFGTVGLQAFFYFGLPLVLALVLPAYDFTTGKEHPRPDIRGTFEGIPDKVGALTGFAGRFPDRRAQAEAKASGGEGGKSGSLPTGTTQPEGPQGQGPNTGGTPTASGGDSKAGVLPEAESPDRESRRGSFEKESSEGTANAKARGMLPQSETGEAVLLASKQADRRASQQTQSGTDTQSPGLGVGALPEDDAKTSRVNAMRQALDKQTEHLERDLSLASAASAFLGHPEVSLALSGAAGLVSQARGSFLPEIEGAQNSLHRRTAPKPQTVAKQNNSFLPKGASQWV